MLWVPCSGCLVTEEFTFEAEPNVPPVLLSVAGEPKIGRIFWIDNSVQSQFELKVQVRDENVEQPLEAHVRIQHQDEMAPAWAPPIAVPPAALGNPVRDLNIFIDTEGLQPYTCHLLELVVSGSFFPDVTEPELFQYVLPEDRDDLAFASWLIWEGEGPSTLPADKLHIIESCEPFADMIGAETIPGGAE